MKNDCVFCAIAAGEIPSFKIYEDDSVLAFLDVNPCAEGHTLVIPKTHVAGLLDAPAAVLAETVAAVQKVAERIRAQLPCDGFNVLQNNGACAGQSVSHLHFHIVPRRDSDTGPKLQFQSGTADKDKLAQLAERLRF